MAKSYTLKDKIKIIIEAIKDKTQGLGWYAASAKSFGKLFNWVESQLGEINKDQRSVLFLGLDAVSYVKVGLNWIGALFESLWIIEQIKSKNDVVGNIVRGLRIGVNILSFGIDIAIMVLVNSAYQNPLILTVATVGLVSKTIVYVKNIRSQVLDVRRLQKLMEDKNRNADEIKYLEFKILKRKWKFLSRAIKFLFSSLSLYLVVISIVNSAPMIIGGLIIVGFSSLITSKALTLLRNSYIADKRPVPRYSDFTLGELSDELKIENARLKKIDDSYARDETKMTELKYAIADKQWYFRMLYVDISFATVTTGIFAIAVYFASPLILIPASIMATAALVTKAIMSVYKQIELESIKPIFLEPEPKEMKVLSFNLSSTSTPKPARHIKFRFFDTLPEKKRYNLFHESEAKNLLGLKVTEAGRATEANSRKL